MFLHYIGIVPRALWKSFFILNFILGLVLLYPLFAILLSRKSWYRTCFRVMRFWGRWIAFVPGVYVNVRREIEKNKMPEPCVYVANHSSYLDIVLSYVVVPNYFIYIGKLEIEKAPLFRIFFRGMNIYVDRKSRSGSYKAFVEASAKLREGESIFIYPEGSIESRGKLKPFKNGAFRIAIENQVPIVPITFRNNWKIMQNGGFFKSHGRPGIARVVVHKPIPTKGMTEEDLIPLRDKVRETIAQTLASK
jgi:1-acyl-sn-glycerol-3-phosphate acyltransferase